MNCEARSVCPSESTTGLVVKSTSPNIHRVSASKMAAPIQKWTERFDLFGKKTLKVVPRVILFSITELPDNCQLLLPVLRPLCGRQPMNDLRFQYGSSKQK